MQLYPIAFNKNLKTLIWGTEDWTVSAVPASESIVSNGPFAGTNLADLVARYSEEILGHETAIKYNSRLPLLTKIIDARQDLSIQVHPDDEMARREHNKSGKSEMWYILDAAPGAYLYAGFKEHITPEEFQQIIKNSVTPLPETSEDEGQHSHRKIFSKFSCPFVKQATAFMLGKINDVLKWELAHDDNTTFRLHKACKANRLCFRSGTKREAKTVFVPETSEAHRNAKQITDVLARHTVKPGDVFYLPAGRVHAICGGIRLVEVQQSSDVTYRIYDYNRPGLDGRPRQLHTELAAQAIDYEVYPEYKTVHKESVTDNVDKILNTPHFSVKVVETTQAYHRNMIKYDSFIIMMNLGNECKIRTRITGHEITLPADASCLMPAAIADYDIIPITGTSKVLEAFINNKKTITQLVTDFFHKR